MLNISKKYKVTLIFISIGFIAFLLDIYLFFTIFEVYTPLMDENSTQLTPVMGDLLDALEKKYK